MFDKLFIKITPTSWPSIIEPSCIYFSFFILSIIFHHRRRINRFDWNVISVRFRQRSVSIWHNRSISLDLHVSCVSTWAKFADIVFIISREKRRKKSLTALTIDISRLSSRLFLVRDFFQIWNFNEIFVLKVVQQ